MRYRNLVITSPKPMRGEDVRLAQHAHNITADDYGLPELVEDGELGHRSLDLLRETGYYRGAPDIQLDGPIRPHLQIIIRAPRRRTPEEFRRGKQRYIRRRRQLREHMGPAAALAWCRTQLGVVEHPSDSNRGGPVQRRRDGVFEGGVSAYQRNFGTDGVYWCGAFTGTALMVAGLRVSSRILWTPDLNDLFQVVHWDHRQPGDLLSLLDQHHQGILDHDREHSFEGNTSPGDEGSQDNGGCVAHKRRSLDQIDYVVRPNWR
jgi:hypothetical protein